MGFSFCNENYVILFTLCLPPVFELQAYFSSCDIEFVTMIRMTRMAHFATVSARQMPVVMRQFHPSHSSQSGMTGPGKYQKEKLQMLARSTSIASASFINNMGRLWREIDHAINLRNSAVGCPTFQKKVDSELARIRMEVIADLDRSTQQVRRLIEEH